jgi:hypothetical protein
MKEETMPTTVKDDEWLARFILFRKWIRSSDQTLRPDAFIPHPWPDLSVTRNLELSPNEIWVIGQGVADQRGTKLLGRGDVQASVPRGQRLQIEAAPIEGNPNHANIAGWPSDKPAQKMIAQEIAAAARFIGRSPDIEE